MGNAKRKRNGQLTRAEEHHGMAKCPYKVGVDYCHRCMLCCVSPNVRLERKNDFAYMGG
jgi:hypothetical protein